MNERAMSDAAVESALMSDAVGEPAVRPSRASVLATRKGEPIKPQMYRHTLMGALLRSRRWYGAKRVAVVDVDERKLTYNDLITGAFALGNALKRGTKRGDALGVLLPTGAGCTVAIFGLSAYGRVPAMLNFTAGASALTAACRAAQATRIITSRKFVEVGNLQGLVADLEIDHQIIYLEDVRENLSVIDKAAGAISLIAPWLIRAHDSPEDTGVILFTSGTEGEPKGVVLSHANLVANAEQIKQHVGELFRTDVVMNPMPMFHCFGLTTGLLLPLYAGVPTVLHPSPLQTKTIVKRMRDHKATILFATDTFLGQYARAASDDDLVSLRFAVCGAERVRDETRALVRKRFGLEVLEGYGATEAAPVISVNQFAFNNPGTTGRLLPGMEGKLEEVPGMDRDSGRFFVRGPNVMKGYIRPSAPGVLEPLVDGWHDTGDIVGFDENDCVQIRGRLKRFAKIGGEMVSLAVVENCATSLWPDSLHAAITVPDARKGEQILLVTAAKDAARAELVAFARNHGVPELAVPRRVIVIDEVPVLGTGKIDYQTVEKLAKEADEAKARQAAEPESVSA